MRNGVCASRARILAVTVLLVCATLLCTLLLRRPSHSDTDEGVDVVYTWVDASDEKWAAARRFYLREGNSSRTQTLDNANEILISLAGLQANWPWVRRVFIATADGQRFSLSPLSTELRKKISFVDHSSFIPLQYLPTFSAPAIEAHLHRIPGLAENFVVLNDDFFVCPMAWEDTSVLVKPLAWRKAKRKFKVLAMRAPLMFKVRACGDRNVWAYSLCNVWRAFKTRMPKKPFPWLFWHGPYFLTRRSFERTWAVFEEEMHRVSVHKNRFYAVNVQPLNLVMNVAVSGYQVLDQRFRFKGFGRKNQTAFVEELGRGLGGGFCQRPVIAFYHQALAKTPPTTSLAFCREALHAYNKSFTPAASGCLCAAMPFGSQCSQ